jgi:uncharacterized membrane protein
LNASSLVAIGRTFFAIALIGLGVEHFVFRDFVTARAPAWPDGVPGKTVWIGSTGILVILAGIAIVARKFGRQAMFAFGFLVFVWALVRHIPIVVGDAILAGSWTAMGKALTFVGGSLAVAGTSPPMRHVVGGSFWRYANATTVLVRIGGICFGLFLIVSGLQHFKFATFVVSLIPKWFPGNHTWWAWFAGVALVAGGVGLIARRTARIAALMSGLMIFSWFWVVHLPRTFLSVSDGMALFEALGFSGIAFVIAGALGDERLAEAP